MLLRSLCGPVFAGRSGWWTCSKSGPAGAWLLARCPPVRGGHPVLRGAVATAVTLSLCVGWTGHIVRAFWKQGGKGEIQAVGRWRHLRAQGPRTLCLTKLWV